MTGCVRASDKGDMPSVDCGKLRRGLHEIPEYKLPFPKGDGVHRRDEEILRQERREVTKDMF